MLKYEIISELGNQKTRKFGSTILIKELSSGKLFVKKSIDKRKTKKAIWDRLVQEGKFDFKHPGLPILYEFHETENLISVVRPYIEGVTLNEYFDQLKRRQKINFTKKLVEKLVPIFERLKAENIVHCDIKPSNILINKRNDDFDVFLIDFGLAVKRTKTDVRKTLFPLGYAAPELLLNQLDIVDSRSDLFSLGIMIWRLFTGELPLKHPNPSIYTNIQLTHPLPDHVSLPKGLLEILQKMTYKFQFKLPPNKISAAEVKSSLVIGMNQRYQSFSEVSTDLNQLQQKKSFYQRISFR